MKTIIGIIQPTIHGNPDGSTAYYFEMTVPGKNTEWPRLHFQNDKHIESVERYFNRPIALSVEDIPNVDGEFIVSTKRPYFRGIDNHG